MFCQTQDSLKPDASFVTAEGPEGNEARIRNTGVGDRDSLHPDNKPRLLLMGLKR